MFPFHHNNHTTVQLNKQRTKYQISLQCLIRSWLILFFSFILFLLLLAYNHDKTKKSANDELIDRIISRSRRDNLVDSIQSKWKRNDKSKLKTENNRGGLSNRDERINRSIGNKQNDKTKEEMKEETKKEQLEQTVSKKLNLLVKEENDNTNNICLTSISQLSHEERHPQKGARHTIDPPPDTNITLVCCQTTAGPLSIAVHTSWAPLGAERFLSMVKAKYFHSFVPLFRCIKKFICQFGLAGTREFTLKFDGHLKDERNWLPEGPSFRKNSDGVYRFAKGYLAYAGGGKNSRSNQLIVALDHNQYLGGGSPWEVPWGEVVGKASFDTLDRIYTGYGDNGPSQGLLRTKGGTNKEIIEKFPKMDFINSCVVVDQVQND